MKDLHSCRIAFMMKKFSHIARCGFYSYYSSHWVTQNSALSLIFSSIIIHVVCSLLFGFICWPKYRNNSMLLAVIKAIHIPNVRNKPRQEQRTTLGIPNTCRRELNTDHDKIIYILVMIMDDDEGNYLSMPQIRCGSVITRSIFSKILTKDTPIVQPLGRGMGVFLG